MPHTHHLDATADTLRGNFSREYDPLITVQSGDTVIYRTLDASWHVYDNPAPFHDFPKFTPRDEDADPGHALVGPVAVEGLQAGTVLEIHFDTLVVGSWGWSAAGFNEQWNKLYHLPAAQAKHKLGWRLDTETNIATSADGHQVTMQPFMGNVGMPEDVPGMQDTFPPRWCGGNLDCKELVAGTTLYLPVPVDGGLLMMGDGHARQGDGELSGFALECPMSHVEVTLTARPDLSFMAPRARTDEGWIAFGVGEDLEQAKRHALDHLLDLMQTLYPQMSRVEAWNLASLVADLRITQIVNGTVGVHGVIPHDAITMT